MMIDIDMLQISDPKWFTYPKFQTTESTFLYFSDEKLTTTEKR